MVMLKQEARHRMSEIDTHDALRALYGPVLPIAERKVIRRLDRHCRDFIALSPFLVLATADPEGGVDASPRGDPPGFVTVIDDTTILIPDRRGNNRLDSLNNVIGAPRVGLIFFVPGIGETLRVNGTARVTTEVAVLAPAALHGKTPSAGLVVAVEEAFFHCAKAVIRSKLWDPSSVVERSSFPSLGQILADQTAGDAADIDARTNEGYATRLY
jgi:PPOX class probable FMN-dependent enzyme